MGLFSKPKPKEIDRRQSLAGIPVRNPDVTVFDDEDDGRAFVKVKVPRGPHFLDRFRPPVIDKRYELDALGCFVLKCVDGQRSARDIVNAFATEYGVNRREAELSVVSFLKMLMQRQIISIVIDGK
jgi:hypothetical protein